MCGGKADLTSAERRQRGARLEPQRFGIRRGMLAHISESVSHDLAAMSTLCVCDVYAHWRIAVDGKPCRHPYVSSVSVFNFAHTERRMLPLDLLNSRRQNCA